MSRIARNPPSADTTRSVWLVMPASIPSELKTRVNMAAGYLMSDEAGPE
jgi:hypothetical protein